MKILVVEDDLELGRQLTKQLSDNGFAVDAATNAEEALFQVNELSYDCIVLDINLPDGSGFDICQNIRLKRNTTPVLIITARDAVEDRVKGLDLGADDYLTKPFAIQELVARVRALIRRSSKESLPTLQIDDLLIDPQTQRVSRGNQQITLTSKEFAVLEFLARHSDEVVTRTMIMEHVWGSDFETFSNVIDVYIRNLRRKIDTTGKIKLLHTIRGGGYSLSANRT